MACSGTVFLLGSSQLSQKFTSSTHQFLEDVFRHWPFFHLRLPYGIFPHDLPKKIEHISSFVYLKVIYNHTDMCNFFYKLTSTHSVHHRFQEALYIYKEKWRWRHNNRTSRYSICYLLQCTTQLFVLNTQHIQLISVSKYDEPELSF
jgi:hypothetical protein